MDENLDFDAIRKGLQQKSTDELLNILKFQSDDYDSKVISIIEELLITRDIQVDDINNAKLAYEERKRIEEAKPKKRTSNVLITILTAIPLMLLGRWVGSNFGHSAGTAVNEMNAPKKIAPWSYEYTKNVKDGLYLAFMNDTPDSTNNKLLAACVSEKLKTWHPNGIDSLDKAVLKSEIKEYVKDCSKNIPIHMYWSVTMQDSMVNGMMRRQWVQKIKEGYRRPLCECYIKHFRKAYPNGFQIKDLTDTIRDDLMLPCISEVKNKKY